MQIEDIPEVAIERRGTALWVVLSRPSAFNAITPRSIGELDTALNQAEADPCIKSLVVTGSGKAFCAGADLKAVLAASSGSSDDAATSRFLRQVGATFNRLETLSIPTIALVNGMTVAGGLELMLCCDLAIASAQARLGDGHANYGQIPGGGGTLRLPRRIGNARAKYLMFTGTTITAEQACEWGLVDEVVGGSIADRALVVTEQIASKSALALKRMKRLVADASRLSAREALAAELQMSDLHMTSHDRNEGLAAFSAKRVPRYIGR